MKRLQIFRTLLLLMLAFTIFSCEIEDDDDDEYGPTTGQQLTNGGTRYQNTIFQAVSTTNNVVFGSAAKTSGGTQELSMSIYQPQGDTEANRPLVILTPGGGFSGLSFETMENYAELLAKAGYVSAVINYRLNESNDRSEARMFLAVVQAVQDQKAAIRFFKKDADTNNQYRINPDKIFIGGHSAGAVTSLHTAYITNVEETSGILATTINNNGGLEGDSGNPRYSSTVAGVINLAGGIWDVNFIDAGEPALYSVHGTADAVVAYISGPADGTQVVLFGSQPIHARAQGVGITSELLAIPDGDHGDPVDITCGSCNVRLLGFLYSQVQ